MRNLALAGALACLLPVSSSATEGGHGVLMINRDGQFVVAPIVAVQRATIKGPTANGNIITVFAQAGSAMYELKMKYPGAGAYNFSTSSTPAWAQFNVYDGGKSTLTPDTYLSQSSIPKLKMMSGGSGFADFSWNSSTIVGQLHLIVANGNSLVKIDGAVHSDSPSF